MILEVRIYDEVEFEVDWKWIEVNVVGEYEYYICMVFVRVGVFFVLLMIEVYWCIVFDLYLSRMSESWSEIEEIEVSNNFNVVCWVVDLLFELGDFEVFILKRNGCYVSMNGVRL